MRTFPSLNNRCTFGLANQQAGSYAPATGLELIRFRPLPFGEIMWHLITQVNNGILVSYITIFDVSRGNCMRFIPLLVYALVYQNIASNLMSLDTLYLWSTSVRTHTCSIFLIKLSLR